MYYWTEPHQKFYPEPCPGPHENTAGQFLNSLRLRYISRLHPLKKIEKEMAGILEVRGGFAALSS
jgi:hypothetical protein